MENRFNDLLNLIEGDTALRMLELSGKRRDTVIEALRLAGDQGNLTVPINIPVTRLADLMTTFFESNDPVSSSWYHGANVPVEWRKRARSAGNPWYSLPEFWEDPEMVVVLLADSGDGKPSQRELRIADFAKGFKLLATKDGGDYAHHFRDILQENEDAGTADIFMQMVVFDEEVYA